MGFGRASVRFTRGKGLHPDLSWAGTVGFVLGASVAAILAISVFLLTDGNITAHETLIAGGMALVGGLASVWYLNKQIKQAADLAEDQRRRQNDAARARLTAALDEIVRYSQATIGSLKSIRSNLLFAASGPPVTRPPLPPFPISPRSSTMIMAACIEVANPEPAASLADLVSKAQVHDARLAGLYEKIIADEMMHPASLVMHFADAVEMYARASSLFRYARRQQETASRLSLEEMLAAARICGLDAAEYSDVHERLQALFGPEDGERT